MSSSDEYQVLSAPEGDHPIVHPRPLNFQVTLQAEEPEAIQDDEPKEAESSLIFLNEQPEDVYNGYIVEPPPPDTPAPSEAPEILVDQVYIDTPEQSLMPRGEQPLQKPIVMMKKTAIMIALMGISLGFLSSLLYFSTQTASEGNNLKKASPIYPQPHTTFFQPILKPTVEAERMSLITMAKRGADFVWESQEVFQVRCVLHNWIRWFYQFWNSYLTKSNRNNEVEEDYVFVDSIF